MAEESLRVKYARLLREGKTSEATKVAQEMNGVETTSSEPVEEEESEVSDRERFHSLKGVGDELAKELDETFESYEAFAKYASAEDLEPIPGIGEKRAESLVEQAAEE